MDDPKIIHTDQIDWYEEDDNYLSYDLAFDGSGYKKKNGSEERQAVADEFRADIKQLIQKRDKKWEKRLAKAREEAFTQGRQKGFEEGFTKAEQEVDDKLDRLEELVEEAHRDWSRRHELLNPGLLDLVFDIAEKIVGLPVENPQIREQLEDELSELLHATDSEVKPQLRVNEKDYRFVEELVEKYTPELSLSIQVSDEYNPGEFELDTQKETVVHRFREKLADLKNNMTLPSWK